MVLDKIYGFTNVTTQKKGYGGKIEFARKGDTLYSAEISASGLSATIIAQTFFRNEKGVFNGESEIENNYGIAL